jgi:hypothetical protein
MYNTIILYKKSPAEAGLEVVSPFMVMRGHPELNSQGFHPKYRTDR